MRWKQRGPSLIPSSAIAARRNRTSRAHGVLRMRANWRPILAAGTIRSSGSSLYLFCRNVGIPRYQKPERLFDRLPDADAWGGHDAFRKIAVIGKPQIRVTLGEIFVVVAQTRDPECLRHTSRATGDRTQLRGARCCRQIDTACAHH